MKSYYDYIIVGAGPAGLAFAQYMSHTGKNILIIDSMGVVGGCHRVVRVQYKENMLFTEHGPRIYLSSYLNFKLLLEKMGCGFHKLFTPYNYFIQLEMLKLMTRCSFRDLIHLSGAFLLFLKDESYGENSTIRQFGKKHNFNQKTINILDRVARMTDGAGADRYTINTLFQLVNQSFFYKVYQPRLPNDVGLFRVWEQYLRGQQNVELMLEHDVVHLSYNKETNRVHSVWVVDKKNHNTIEIKCHNVVLATPPHAIAGVLKNCDDMVKNSFMPYPKLLKFVENTDYNQYISLTFHWDTKQENVSYVHGFPTGEWGVIFIVLTDYMDMTNEYSKTLVSCCVSYLDHPSSHTGKTANQSNGDEVIEETFRQLKEVMPLLSKPDVALISPQNSYDPKQNKWSQHDVSYFSTMKEKPMKNRGGVENLYNVGTHNGDSVIKNTTLESAVSNALVLAYSLDPNIKSLYPFQRIRTLRGAIKILVIILLSSLVLIFILLWNKEQKKKESKK